MSASRGIVLDIILNLVLSTRFGLIGDLRV